MPGWHTHVVLEATELSYKHTMGIEICCIRLDIGRVPLGNEMYRLIHLLLFAKAYSLCVCEARVEDDLLLI